MLLAYDGVEWGTSVIAVLNIWFLLLRCEILYSYRRGREGFCILNAMPCSFLERFKRFGGSCCLLLQGGRDEERRLIYLGDVKQGIPL
jgi:hypothetical protein